MDASTGKQAAEFPSVLLDRCLLPVVTSTGKSILITGCDSKLGSALAQQLDSLGFTVYAGCLRIESEIATKIKSGSSGRLHLISLDVTSESEISSAINYIKKNLPHSQAGIWAVINCASWAAFGEVEWAPFSNFQRSAEVNLLGTIRVTQGFLPLLRATGGRIINVVSLLGRVSSQARAPYCTVKSALEAFVECLRLEMKRWGVDVILVEPGDSLTGALEWFSEERVLRQAKEAWIAMSDEQKKEYGEKHFVNTVRAVHDYIKEDKEIDLAPVLRALVDAVVRTFPLPRYQVFTPAEWVQTQVAEHFPRSIYNILYN
ncbi:D-beta-hydroxybutyrate dehydrogenase, mitochondrial-like isoform X2 [Neocloeon triangulifer]|uniref:D-beta-hydroxybutyrate dehydrogenase, mitochondrial-like isoform X2 n=1 Tax=Neocloeon triangulifer TaxID=2078957 RepID=UPI00286EBEAC|nr:D-beta-hydroxybutyrate dehydrogenase, mitochondrial-like isoform X2 [Neocloeon triangulifer]